MSKKTIGVCDENIYDALYREHAEKICYYLYYKYGDMEKAQDIVQDSFAKLWIDCAKIFLGAAKSFLYKIANNASINSLVHQKTILKYKQIPQKRYTNESPEFQMEEKEFLQRLNAAISGLKDGQREVFLLNRIEKKTYKEIAELLGISVKSVEKRMRLALLFLRKKINTPL